MYYAGLASLMTESSPAFSLVSLPGETTETLSMPL